jgi:hypothetical protein
LWMDDPFGSHFCWWCMKIRWPFRRLCCLYV